jgi:DMSO/TMAO reductase YedYZ molybdopterin-dependent catalytic subunit
MTKPTSKLLAISQSLDRDMILKDAERLLEAPSRRLFAKRAITLGGLSLLTGCQLTNEKSVNQFLTAVSRLNDGVQGWMFDPKQLAPTYPESMLTKPFPFNAFYDIDSTPEVDGESYKLEVSGLVQDKHAWTLPELYALPQTSQITRHICVEGWSAIGHWGGTSFAGFLKRIGADTSAKYIGFKCADDYFESHRHGKRIAPAILVDLHL